MKIFIEVNPVVAVQVVDNLEGNQLVCIQKDISHKWRELLLDLIELFI